MNKRECESNNKKNSKALNNEKKLIKQKVSYNDPQLKDIINNFNEANEYLKLLKKEE